MRSGGRGHQHALERAQVAAIIAQVTDVYGVALAALDGGGDVLAADTRHDVSLNVVHGQPVARQLVAPQIEIQEITAAHALGVNAAGARHFRQGVFNLLANLLDLVEVGAQHLDADGRAHAGGEHVHAVADGHGPGVGGAGDAQGAVHLIHQVVLRNAVRPDVAQAFSASTPGRDAEYHCGFFRHWSCGFRRTVVSTIESGAGSVEVSARPALPNTRSTSGNVFNRRSWICSSRCASASEIPGSVVGM